MIVGCSALTCRPCVNSTLHWLWISPGRSWNLQALQPTFTVKKTSTHMWWAAEVNCDCKHHHAVLYCIGWLYWTFIHRCGSLASIFQCPMTLAARWNWSHLFSRVWRRCCLRSHRCDSQPVLRASPPASSLCSWPPWPNWPHAVRI